MTELNLIEPTPPDLCAAVPVGRFTLPVPGNIALFAIDINVYIR